MPSWWHRRRDLENANAQLRARITELENELTAIKARWFIESTLGIPLVTAPPPETPALPAPKRTKRHLGVYDGANAVILAVLSGLAAAVAAARRNTAHFAWASATATVVAAALVITFEGGDHHGRQPSIALRAPTSPTATQPATEGPPVGSPTPVAATVASTATPVFLRVGTRPPEGSTTAPTARSLAASIADTPQSTPSPTQTETAPPPSDPPPLSTSPPVGSPPPPQCLTIRPLAAVCLPQLLTLQL